MQEFHQLGLTDKQREDKKTYIGGSTAKLIWDGKWDEAYDRITGKGEDLSGIFHVQLGNVTEKFNLAWQADANDWKLRFEDEVIRHSKYPFIGALVDAIGWNFIGKDSEMIGEFVIDAKHISELNEWNTIEKVSERYYWQAQNNMLATGIHQFCLSIIAGNKLQKPVWIAFNKEHAKEYLELAKKFWKHIEEGKRPNPVEGKDAVEIPTEFIDYNMNGNNQWANNCIDFIENETAAKLFEISKKTLKQLTPKNARKATGHGVEIKRDRAGRLHVEKTYQLGTGE